MIVFKKLLKKTGFWSETGPKMDIVLTSRIRLARNMKSMPFPDRMTDQDYKIIRETALNFIHDADNAAFTLIDLGDMHKDEKRLLRERNLITERMENSSMSFLLTDQENDRMILVNEADHFHIQIIKPGLQLHQAYEDADILDNELGKYVKYAFDADLGFVTSDPSSMGTGLRASVMLHLPVLTMKKKVQFLTDRMQNSGVELRSVVEDKRPVAGIYQLSNRISLGMTEQEILNMITVFINKLVELEDYERDNYLSVSRLELEDTVGRSYGLLKHSRKMSYTEAMEHLSIMRLGVILALVKNISISAINDIMVRIQLSHLQHDFGKPFISSSEADEYRSRFINKYLN